MGECFLNQSGGGNPLNFKVVGNPQPENPKDNIIWVNTDVKIKTYFIETKQPKNMQNGDLWIETAAASDKEFNALKKNTLMVYPVKLHQYVDDELLDLEGKIRLDGKWIDFETLDYVVRKGVLVPGYTIVSTTTTNEIVGDCLVFRSTKASSGNGKVIINEDGASIDFTNRSVLYLDVEATSPRSGTDDFVTIGVTGGSTIQKNIGVNNPLARQIMPIDLSGISSGEISLFISDNPTTVELKIYNAWFE